MAALLGDAGLSTSSASTSASPLARILPNARLRHGASFSQVRPSRVKMTGSLVFHGTPVPLVPRRKHRFNHRYWKKKTYGCMFVLISKTNNIFSVVGKTDVRASSSGSDTERKFQTTVELDLLIDNLRSTDEEQLPQVVAENILVFNTDFWLRLATRADSSKSSDDRRDFEAMATSIMQIVHLIVQKTQERIETSTDILKSILAPLIEKNGEIVWPPRKPEGIAFMRKNEHVCKNVNRTVGRVLLTTNPKRRSVASRELDGEALRVCIAWGLHQEVKVREEGGYLDESFLSEVSAQLRQAREDGDKPGLVAILQKVLQLYCSVVMSKRSYAKKDDGVDKAEELLEKLISGDEESWNNVVRDGLVFGGGSVETVDFSRVAEKRVERTLMRSETGSYQQRLLVEYVREIQTRAELLAEAFQAPGSGS